MSNKLYQELDTILTEGGSLDSRRARRAINEAINEGASIDDVRMILDFFEVRHQRERRWIWPWLFAAMLVVVVMCWLF